MNREHGFLDHIIIRIDSVIVGAAQICSLQYGAAKERPVKVAVDEFGFGEVGFGEVCLGHGAIFKKGLFVLLFIKDGIVKNAAFKMHLEQKIAGLTKIQSNEFTMFKLNVLKTGITGIGKGQVAAIKHAVNKNYPVEVGMGEIAGNEFAVFIGAVTAGELWSRGFGESFVLDVLHFASIRYLVSSIKLLFDIK
jgi:hypothetical protein